MCLFLHISVLILQSNSKPGNTAYYKLHGVCPSAPWHIFPPWIFFFSGLHQTHWTLAMKLKWDWKLVQNQFPHKHVRTQLKMFVSWFRISVWWNPGTPSRKKPVKHPGPLLQKNDVELQSPLLHNTQRASANLHFHTITLCSATLQTLEGAGLA